MPTSLTILLSIISNRSAIVTLEEAGRSGIKDIRQHLANRDFDFFSYKSTDESVNRSLDHIKQCLADNNKVDALTEEELSFIRKEVLLTCSLDYEQRKELEEVLDGLLAGINDYINEHLSIGEKLILHREDEILRKETEILGKLDEHTEN